MEKEMKLNKYLSVKLIDGQVYTYINDERFLQCRHVIMNIPVKEAEELEGFDSIDDIIEYSRNRGYYHGTYNQLDPEVEFMVHCSNLQAWVENDYDTRIIDSRLAFPLLQMIAEFDPKAKTILAEEICSRFFSGSRSTQLFLFSKGLVDIAIHYSPLEFTDWLNSNSGFEPKYLLELYNLLFKHYSANQEILPKLKEFNQDIIFDDFFKGKRSKFNYLSTLAKEEFINDNIVKVVDWFLKNLDKINYYNEMMEIYNLISITLKKNPKLKSNLKNLEDQWVNSFNENIHNREDLLIYFDDIDFPRTALKCAEWLSEDPYTDEKIRVFQLFPNILSFHPEINNQLEIFRKRNSKRLKKDLITIVFRLAGVPPDQAIRKITININRTIREIKELVIRAYNLNPFLSVQLIIKGRVLPDGKYFKEVIKKYKKDLYSQKVFVLAMIPEGGG